MLNCHCDHPASDHAPVQDFGISLCLVVDCDCDGTREQVAALERDRRSAKNLTLQALVDTIAEVLRNPMPRTIDDTARNIAAAIVGNFKVEER